MYPLLMAYAALDELALIEAVLPVNLRGLPRRAVDDRCPRARTPASIGAGSAAQGIVQMGQRLPGHPL